jgi:hypothetical protein
LATGTIFFNGKMRRLASGKAVLSTTEGPCCCGPCDPNPNECTDIECTSMAFTACCWKCGDTASVTFGGITAGTASVAWVGVAVGFMIPAVENQTITGTLSGVDKDPSPGGSSNFDWFSGELGRDTTHVYGAWVSISANEGGFPLPSDMTWIVQVFVWRVPIADWNKPGECQEIEYEVVISESNAGPPRGTCCGQDGGNPIPIGDAIDSVDPVTDFVPSTDCDSVCDCGDFPNTYLLEADCAGATVTSGSDDCRWTNSYSTGSLEECDLIETSITLRKSNSANGEGEYFCGWVIEIFQTIYGPVGETCDIVEVRDIVAYKVGGDPDGTYIIASGTGCGTEIEVS